MDNERIGRITDRASSIIAVLAVIVIVIMFVGKNFVLGDTTEKIAGQLDELYTMNSEKAVKLLEEDYGVEIHIMDDSVQEHELFRDSLSVSVREYQEEIYMDRLAKIERVLHQYSSEALSKVKAIYIVEEIYAGKDKNNSVLGASVGGEIIITISDMNEMYGDFSKTLHHELWHSISQDYYTDWAKKNTELLNLFSSIDETVDTPLARNNPGTNEEIADSFGVWRIGGEVPEAKLDALKQYTKDWFREGYGEITNETND